MKKHTWIYLIHISLIAMVACDRNTPVASEEPFDIALHMQMIEENVIIPVRNRITTEDLAGLRTLTEKNAEDLSAAEGERLTQIMETVMLPSERAYLTSVARSMIDAYPEMKRMNVHEMQSFLQKSMPAGDVKGSGDSVLCEAAAAAAAAQIVAIEAAWMLAMIGCTTTTIAYALCAGIATTVKYAALLSVFIDLAYCE
ncbi:MAG: hypothetical protein ACNA8K_01180 [Cyclonatronaceae bacterium]